MAETASAAPLRRAAVLRLSLTDFRNYAAVSQVFGERCVVLHGHNGSGKTNLLEAISLFSPGRGLRRAAFAELARADGPGGWAVAAEVDGAQGRVRIGTGQLPQAGAAEADAPPRQCRLDGASVRSPGAFAEHLRITWLTPAQDRLFTGPASDRRRFLDRLVATVDPGHHRALSALEQALRERNRLLTAGPGDTAWLSAIEAQLAAAAVAVAAGRVEACARLAVLLETRARSSEFPPARVAVDGEMETSLAETAAVEVEDRYRERLRNCRPRDQAAGRTLDGPHRSDLKVVHGRTGVAAGSCSTGEQKALLISMILAEARLIAADFGGVAPVILLDEVAAHLDAARRAALFEELIALGGQAWLTGTDRLLFEGLSDRALFVCVEAGRLVPEA